MSRSGLVWVWVWVRMAGGPPHLPCLLMHTVLLLTRRATKGMQPRACHPQPMACSLTTRQALPAGVHQPGLLPPQVHPLLQHRRKLGEVAALPRLDPGLPEMK